MGFSKKRAQRYAKLEKANQEAAEAKYRSDMLAYINAHAPFDGYGDTTESLLAEDYHDESTAFDMLASQAKADFEARAEAHLTSLLGTAGYLVNCNCWSTDTFLMLACETTSGNDEYLSVWLTEELNRFAAGTPFEVTVCAYLDPAIVNRNRFEDDTVAYLERLLGAEGIVVDNCWNTDTIFLVDCKVSRAAVPNDQLADVTSWLNEEMDRFDGGTRYTVDVTVSNGSVQ